LGERRRNARGGRSGSILRASRVDCLQPLPGASVPTLSEKFSDFDVATNQVACQEEALIKSDDMRLR